MYPQFFSPAITYSPGVRPPGCDTCTSTYALMNLGTRRRPRERTKKRKKKRFAIAIPLPADRSVSLERIPRGSLNGTGTEFGDAREGPVHNQKERRRASQAWRSTR